MCIRQVPFVYVGSEEDNAVEFNISYFSCISYFSWSMASMQVKQKVYQEDQHSEKLSQKSHSLKELSVEVC